MCLEMISASCVQEGWEGAKLEAGGRLGQRRRQGSRRRVWPVFQLHLWPKTGGAAPPPGNELWTRQSSADAPMGGRAGGAQRGTSNGAEERVCPASVKPGQPVPLPSWQTRPSKACVGSAIMTLTERQHTASPGSPSGGGHGGAGNQTSACDCDAGTPERQLS